MMPKDKIVKTISMQEAKTMFNAFSFKKDWGGSLYYGEYNPHNKGAPYAYGKNYKEQFNNVSKEIEQLNKKLLELKNANKDVQAVCMKLQELHNILDYLADGKFGAGVIQIERPYKKELQQDSKNNRDNTTRESLNQNEFVFFHQRPALSPKVVVPEKNLSQQGVSAAEQASDKEKVTTVRRRK